MVELAYIGGLVLAGGDGVRARVVAAVLLFRLLTYGLQIPLGAITYPVWRRKASWPKAASAADASDASTSVSVKPG